MRDYKKMWEEQKRYIEELRTKIPEHSMAMAVTGMIAVEMIKAENNDKFKLTNSIDETGNMICEKCKKRGDCHGIADCCKVMRQRLQEIEIAFY